LAEPSSPDYSPSLVDALNSFWRHIRHPSPKLISIPLQQNWRAAQACWGDSSAGIESRLHKPSIRSGLDSKSLEPFKSQMFSLVTARFLRTFPQDTLKEEYERTGQEL
jgi:hypothetical protein